MTEAERVKAGGRERQQAESIRIQSLKYSRPQTLSTTVAELRVRKFPSIP